MCLKTVWYDHQGHSSYITIKRIFKPLRCNTDGIHQERQRPLLLWNSIQLRTWEEQIYQLHLEVIFTKAQLTGVQVTSRKKKRIGVGVKNVGMLPSKANITVYLFLFTLCHHIKPSGTTHSFKAIRKWIFLFLQQIQDLGSRNPPFKPTSTGNQDYKSTNEFV